MKKLVCAIVMMASVAVFAANNTTPVVNNGDVYTGAAGGNYPSSYTSSTYSYANGVFTFNKNFVWTDFSRRIDMSNKVNENINLDEITAMGYYTVDANGVKTGDYVTLYTKDGVVNNSVIFEKGQKVGIFMDIKKDGQYVKAANGRYCKDSDGNFKVWNQKTDGNKVTRYDYVKNDSMDTVRWTTTDTPEGAENAVAKIDPDSWSQDKKGNYSSSQQYFCLFQNDAGKGSHFEYYFDGLLSSDVETIDDFIDIVKENGGLNGSTIISSEGTPIVAPNGDIIPPAEDEPEVEEPTEEAPSGQPLPGLLTTLILGGAAVAGGRAAKKRKNAKRA